MREWQVGDPIGDGNDIGVPDTKYMGYLKNDSRSASCPNNISRAKKHHDEAWELKGKHRLFATLNSINLAIELAPNDAENWNLKGIILWKTFKEIHNSEISKTVYDAYESFNRALEISPSEEIIKNNKRLFLYDWADALYDTCRISESIKRIDEYLSMANKTVMTMQEV